MNALIVFGLLSIPLIIVSRRTLFDFRSHGFYRFLSWECIVWLLINNYKFWFADPFSILQLCSWSFLFWSLYPAIAGYIRLKKGGKPGHSRADKSLYPFEKTSALVDTGIYKYIRHPLYSSLLFLTWGILLKHITPVLFCVALFSTFFLFLTALYDEKECIAYFGSPYRAYIKRTRRFIPFLL